MNPNALFLIVIAVLFICFFAGRRAGLIRTLIPIASALASFCLVAIAAPIFGEELTEDLAELQFIDAMISVLSFAVAFFILRWLIRAILKFFRLIGDVPIAGSIDRALGGIAGFAGGLIIIWSAFFFLLLFYGPEGLPELFDAINGNAFVRLLYNNNLVMTLINYFIFAA